MRSWGLLLLLLWPAVVGATPVTGRVVEEETPLAGMIVSAYGNLDPSGTPVARSTATAADGLFRLDLPAGNYGLYARSPGGDRFAFCGRNPVAVAAEPVWAGLQAVAVVPAGERRYDDEFSAAVEGRVVFEGKPLEGAYVSLYLDVADDLKGQGYRMSPPTGPDGSFAFDSLPESDYFLVARKRSEGGRVGPVLEGDYLALYPGNPLSAKSGRVTTVTLAAVRKVKESAASETFGRSGGPRLVGVVVDRAGKGVAGLHVFAYTDRVIGHQRPAALSPGTEPPACTT